MATVRRFWRAALSLACAVAFQAGSPLRLGPGRQAAPRVRLAAGKDILISVWLFGGLVPALAGVNVFAVQKLRAPLPESYVMASADAGGPELRLASALSPDRVLVADVEAALGPARSAADLGAPLVPLSVIMGAPATRAAAALYLRKEDFKAAARKRARRQLPDSALDALFDAWAGGSGAAAAATVDRDLAQWRRNDGSLDLGAVDLAALRGRGTVLAGFAGLAAIDAVALAALAFGIKNLEL